MVEDEECVAEAIEGDENRKPGNEIEESCRENA